MMYPLLLSLFGLSLVSATSTTDAEEPRESMFPFIPTNVTAPFLEQFNGGDWHKKWIASEESEYVGKWLVEDHSVYAVIAGDRGLVAKTKAARHAISAALDKPVDFKKPLIVQYEVKYQQGGTCGGGYLKLLEEGFGGVGRKFDSKTPWTIMFGPDLTCPGTKVHFIFRYPNPKTGEFEEKHLKTPPSPHIGKITNFYRLIVNPDQTFKVIVNEKELASGSLLEDFEPPVNPPKEIDDPSDSKPESWVDAMMIDDPDASKPEDWDEEEPYEVEDEDATVPEGWLEDEPETITDPEAKKPDEWDDAEDGDWVAPTISNPKCSVGCGPWKRPMKSNPKYKGKWYAPQIKNPAYKGEWSPRKIKNPNYFKDKKPTQSLRKIGGVGIELWTMTEDILFDNIYIGHSLEDADRFAKETFWIKEEIERRLEGWKPAPPEEDNEPKFTAAPVAFIKYKVTSFLNLAKTGPLLAIKTMPGTAGALAITLLAVFGVYTKYNEIVEATRTKLAKKTDAPSPDSKPAPADTQTPVAPAGEEKTEPASATKRRK